MTSARILGGEAQDRTLLGQQSRPRLVALAVVVVGPILWAGLTQSFWPLLIIIPGLPGAIIVTQETHRGTMLSRWVARRRWKSRVSAGHDRYVPYSDAAWEDARAADAAARTRAERKAAARTMTRLRTMPDGAAGLGWLRSTRREPGIAWQSYDGGDAVLTVVFEVGGQNQGAQEADAVDAGARAFGRFLANHGPAGKLARRVQSLTRVLPSDTAEHQAWVVANLNEDAPEALMRSYEEVVAEAGDVNMSQRHFIVCSWPVTGQFLDAAAAYGEGRVGWRGLMDEEIASMTSQLRQARYTFVNVLSARQVAGIMRHMQDPDQPIDSVAGVRPDKFGVPSADEFSAYVTAPSDERVWWHRTAALDGSAFAAAPRLPLWHDQLLGGGMDCVRTVSFHHELIPAAEARARAQKDLTSDAAEKATRRKKGQVDDAALDVTEDAAARRNADIAPGSHHHGDAWVGYVTISTTSRLELQRACRQLEDLCADIGIESVRWLDSYQSAAAGTTWPLGRGIRRSRVSVGSRVMSSVAGKRGSGEL